MQYHVGIIGAGLSGLVTAKTLLEYGHRVTVFEKEDGIGGVWAASRYYPGLTIQNTRDTYAFSDFPMPKEYPEFPDGRQMRAYLYAYADRFGVLPHVRLNHWVREAQPLDEGQGWLLRGEEGGIAVENRVDYLVVCNGTFSEPLIPTVPGMEAFRAGGGRILHTTQLQREEDYAGKRVAIVGFGKSACDVAGALAGESAQIYLLYRKTRWKVPKRIMGINYKYFVLNRFGEALFKPAFRSPVESVMHALRLPNFILGNMQGVFGRQQGLKRNGLMPDLPLYAVQPGELSVESDHFYTAVQQGAILPIEATIKAFVPGGVHLSDGNTLAVDTVVYGTGYAQQLPFFSPALQTKLTDALGNFQFYRHILPLQVPALAFVGYNSSFFCNLGSEMAALWLAEHLAGGFRLPDETKMAAEITAFQTLHQRYPGGLPLRGACVYPFNITYVDQLLGDMGARLPLPLLLKEWLLVVEPGHYAAVKEKIRRRTQAKSAGYQPLLPINQKSKILHQK